MNAETPTASKNCTRPENREGNVRNSGSQLVRVMTVLERIDMRIEAKNFAAARRLLRFLDKNKSDNAFINEQIAATAEQLQDWPVLLRALIALIEKSQPEDAIDDLVFRVVQVLIEKLNRPDEAVTFIREYFQSFISHPGSVQWARRHLLRGPYRQVLLNIARTRIVKPLDNTQNINVFNALGTWYAARPDQYRSAFQWYRKTLSIMPGNPDAIDGLISLHS